MTFVWYNRFSLQKILQEFYDFKHRLFRLDGYYDGAAGGDAGPFRVIHDFSTSVAYIQNLHTGNCSVSSLSDTILFGDITSDSDGNLDIISPNQFFFLNNEFSYSYEGVSTVRGVMVDSWITSRSMEKLSETVNLTSGTYEAFFTRPGYSVTTDRSAGESIVPWRLMIDGLVSYQNFTDRSQVISANVSYQLDFFDFSSREPPYDAFDVSLCFSAEETAFVVLVFETPRVGIDFGTLRTNIRASIVDYTGLLPLQVANIRVSQLY